MVKIKRINNFKVLLIPVKNTNVVYVQSFILSGYMNETPATSGISHLLEHVLGDSWSKCNDDCAKYWGDRGIISNASTSDTTINYYIEGLHKDLEEIIEYIVKITTNPQITNARIEKEKNAVREELKREMNDPYWKITKELTERIYKHSGLKSGMNIPLQLKNLKHFNKRSLEKFCNKIYTPKNILFMVAGNIQESNITQLFHKYLPRNAYPGTKNVRQNVLTTITRPQIYHLGNPKSKSAELCIAFSTSLFPWERDVNYFSLIEYLFTDGLNSLLMSRLRGELHLIYNITMDLETNVTGSLALIETTCKEENVAAVVSNIKDIIKNLQQGHLEDRQLTRVKDISLIYEETDCKTPTYYGDLYGEQYAAQLFREKPVIISPKDKLHLIKNTTKQDIIRVSRKIFPLNKAIILYQSKNKQTISL